MPDICLQHMIAVMLLDKTASFEAAHDKARMSDPAVRGIADNPMPREEVVLKARDLCAPVIGKAQTDALVAKVLALETLPTIRDLRAVLRKV